MYLQEGEKSMKIIKNAVRCKICGDEIESKYRHDYATCGCGACSVDGGHNYLRRSFVSTDCFEDISVVITNEEENSSSSQEQKYGSHPRGSGTTTENIGGGVK